MRWGDETTGDLWIKSKTDVTDTSISTKLGKPATTNRHPISSLSSINCTDQCGIPGSWCERLPHFKIDFAPSSGEELQSEYFVSREQGVSVINELNSLFGNQLSTLSMITEIRLVAKSPIWLSGAYDQDVLAIHFTWFPFEKDILEFLPILETVFCKYLARPHWGKLFAMDDNYLSIVFPKYYDFQALLRKYDPQQKFRNCFIDTLFPNHDR